MPKINLTILEKSSIIFYLAAANWAMALVTSKSNVSIK